MAEPDVSLAPDVLSVLMTLITRHTRPGSPVIVPTPAYMPFLSLPGVVGRDCLQVRALQGRDARGNPTWELDLEGIEAAMASGGGLLVLCNPWNPVGRVLSLSELDAVAALSARYGVPVFADEIHAMLVIDPDAAHTPYACRPGADPALTFTATSVSKAFNVPGLRCAQLIATGPGRAAWDADGPSRWLSHGATLLGVQAAVAALRRGLGRAHLPVGHRRAGGARPGAGAGPGADGAQRLLSWPGWTARGWRAPPWRRPARRHATSWARAWP